MDRSESEDGPLRPLRVDLAQLVEALANSFYDMSWHLDTATGEIVLVSTDVDIDMDEQLEAVESEQFIAIPKADSRAGYDDMQQFIETVRDPRLRDLLEVAIEGRGAFRRFKDVVARDPNESKRWYEFSNRQQEDRAREWLAEVGFELAPKDTQS